MFYNFVDIAGYSNPLNFDLIGFMLMGHIAFGRDKLVPIGKIHYFLHWLYGKYEPQILRITDWVLRKKFMTDTAIGRAFCIGCASLGHYLPHGIVVTTQSATNLIRYIDSLKSQDHSPRLAVGPAFVRKP